MAQFTQAEFANWIAIYVAAGICCAIAMALTLTTLAGQLIRERAWRQLTSIRAVILFVPKTWWRWQKLYLHSTPVTLAIVGWFGATLNWS